MSRSDANRLSSFVKRESAYKREKVAKYGSECSEIIPSFLYVGGNGVAEDFGYFTAHGITHVVNCAGNTVQNYHADKHITYMTLDMLDDGHNRVLLIFSIFSTTTSLKDYKLT